MKLMLRDLKAVNQSTLNAPGVNMSIMIRILLVCLTSAISFFGLKAQITVFNDDFQGTTSTLPVTGTGSPTFTTGTSPLMTYTALMPTAGASTTVATVSTTKVLLYNNGSSSPANGQGFISGALSTFLSPFNTTLSSNAGIITWVFNMRLSTTANGTFVSGGGSAAIGVVLCNTTTTPLTSGNGYAVIGYTSSGQYSLIKFTGGLNGTKAVIGTDTYINSGAGTNYEVFKVTYDPATNNWSFFAGTPSSTLPPDPTSATFVQVGTTLSDNTYTSTVMSTFGFAGQHSSSSSRTFAFDNFKVTVTPSCTAPIFSTQPTDNQVECAGAALTLGTVAASPSPTYQWYSNTSKINTGGTSVGSTNGGNTATFTPSSATPGTFYYYCVATNGTCNTASNAVQITVNGNPTGSVAGGNQTITNGNSANLAANNPSVGTGAWSISSGPSTSTTQFSSIGANNATFTPSGGAGSYVLVWTISNPPCTASSSSLTITVNAATVPLLTLASAANTENQSVPINTAISNIVYTIGGTATTAAVTWTGTANATTPPNGISVNVASPTVTISGSPTSAGTYGYTVTTDGSPAASDGGTITATVSSAKDITAFTFAGQVGGSTIGANTIAITMPAGTMRYGLAPNLIMVSANASVSPAVSVPQDFRSPVQYTVTAQDNSTKVYTVTVTNQPSPNPTLTWLTSSAIFDGTGYDVAGVGTYYRATGGGTGTVESPGGSCHGSTSSIRMGSSLFVFKANADISAITLYGNSGTGSSRSLDAVATSSSLGGPYTNLSPVATASGNLSGSAATNFCSPSPMTITFNSTITAGTYFRVTLSGNAYIAAIDLLTTNPAVPKLSTPIIPAVNYATPVTNQGFTAHWNDVSDEIGYKVEVYNGSNTLVKTVNGIAANATSTIVTGLLSNTNYTFKVTAIGDGDAYSDSDPSAASAAIRTLSTEKDITSFVIASVSASIIGSSITATLPYGTDATALTPTVAVSANATYGPTSAQNFTSPVDYTVTAEDGSTKVYTATISVSTTPPGPILSAAPGQTVAAPFTITFTDNQAWRDAVTGYQVDGGSTIPVATPGTSLTSGFLTFNPADITALRLPQSHTVIVYATGFENTSVTQTTIAGPATHITVTNVAAPAINSGALATQPVVTFKDLYENVATSTATVNATATSGSWVIGGTSSKDAIAGLASFTNLTAATSDGNALALATITFTSGAFTVASNTFTIPPYQTAPGDYFRTITSGDWNATDPATVWQSSPNGSNWFAATAGPSSASGTITISPSTQVTVSSNVTVDQLIVAADGELVVNSGVTFTVADGSGTDVVVNGLFTNKGAPATLLSGATMNIASGGTYKMDAAGGTIPSISASFSYSTGSTLYIGKTPVTGNPNGRIPSTSSSPFNFPGSVIWDDNTGPAFSSNIINSSNNAVQISGDFIMKNGLAMAGNGDNDRTLTVLGNIIVEGGQLAAKADFGSNNGTGDFSIVCAGDVTVTGGALYLVGAGANTSGGGGHLTVAGNISNTGGSFGINRAGTNGTITLNGGALQTLETTGQATVGTTHVVLNNTAGLTLLSNLAVNGNVTLTNGRINTGTNKLSVATTSNINSVSSLKYINGRLEKGVANGATSKTFEIGDAANYLPVIIDFVGGTSVQGSLTVSTTPEEHDDIINSGIKPDHSVNRYFTVTNNGVGLKAAGYNITLPYADADKDFLADEAKFKVAKYDGVAWVAPASSTPNAGSNTTTGNGFTSFSEFVIGEGTTTTTSITNVVATYGDDIVTLTSGIIPPQAIGLVHFFVDGLEVGTGMNVGGTATLQLDPSGFAVGPHVIYATFVADGGYESSISANGNLTIQPKELIPVITVANKVYDAGVTASATLVELTGKETGDDVSGSITSAEFDDANVADNKNVTVYLSISGADVANYTVGNPVYKTANITPASATISVTGYSGTYDGNAHGASATISGVGGEDLNANLDLGNSYTDAPGGTADWSFANSNYVGQNGSVNIVINKATATVSVSGYAGTYDGLSHGATGTATGLGGIDLGSGLSLGASFTDAPGGTAHWVFTGGTNYKDLEDDVAITIGKADATIVVSGYNGTYDGAEHGASLVSIDGVAGEDLSGSINLGNKFKDVPGGTAHWTFSGGSNYEDQSGTVDIEINKTTAIVSVSGYTGTYDGNSHGATGTATGVNGENLSASLNLGSRYTDAPGGVANWTFSNSNYGDQGGAVNIIINKAAAIVIVSGYTGTYDGNAHGATGTATGLGGVDLSGSLNLGSSYTNAPGGTANWTFSGGTNYADQNGSVAIVINDCLPLDASASGTPVKLGADAILSATVSPATAGISVTFYLDDVPKGSCTTNAAGTASITVSSLGVDVYKVKAVAGAGCPESIAYLPVYDPSGGFITGGGWIMSPAGAYAANKSLTGKANFGFNAKYKKGSSAVDGNTEFQFQAGGLNFKSTQHDAGTLVIATFKGIFKGIGTVNGEAGYSFMVSAIDGQINGGGGVDKFRIKIWNTLTSATVYDNGVDPLTGNYLDANAAPTTALGGGSIVIQEAKTNSKAAQRIDPDVLVTSLDARVFNNPAAGASSFRLKLLSPDAEHPINVKVVDMTGKSLQAVQSTAGQTVEFGATFRSGMYIAEISQNGQRKLVKLVKQ